MTEKTRAFFSIFSASFPQKKALFYNYIHLKKGSQTTGQHMRDPSEAATETIKPSSSSSLTEATYSLQNEDHTLGNCLRYQLNKNPGVLVAGYSVPHPMERKVNVRVQTVAPVTADGAMREALLDVVSVCEHVTETFEEALKEGPKTTTAAKK